MNVTVNKLEAKVQIVEEKFSNEIETLKTSKLGVWGGTPLMPELGRES